MSIRFHVEQQIDLEKQGWEERDVILDLFRSLHYPSDPKWLENQIKSPSPVQGFPGIIINEMTGHVTDILLYDVKGITGSIPASIGQLKELRRLQLVLVSLDALPEELGQLENLENLYISGIWWDANRRSRIKAIPKSFGNLKNLKELTIDHSDIESIPTELSGLTNLEKIEITDSKLRMNVFDAISKIPSIKYLTLSFDSTIKGYVPKSIGNLTELRYLNLIDVYGLPKSIGNLTQLKEIHLSQSNITELPAEMANLRKLEVLGAAMTKLSGEIPSWISSLTALKELHLQDNKLSGSIPNFLGNLKNLEVINLDDNKLTGSIPSSLTTLPALRELGLYNNKLSGEIPTGFGNLPNLQTLRLSYNQLSGAVPDDITKIKKKVWLDHNNLSGKLPEKFFDALYWRNSWGSIVYENHFDMPERTWLGPEILEVNDGEFPIGSEYGKHRYTILFQWEAGCQYLDDAAKMMLQIHKKYARKGVEIIGRGFDNPATRKAIAEYKMPWRMVYSQQLNYPCHVVPTITVFDQSGVLVFSDLLQDRFTLPDLLEKWLANE